MDAELHREFNARNLINSISHMYSNKMRTKLRQAVQIYIGTPSCHRATFFFGRLKRNQLDFTCVSNYDCVRNLMNDDTISRKISSKQTLTMT